MRHEHRQRIIGMVLIALLLISNILFIGFYLTTKKQQQSGYQASDEQLIQGGKRFIDYLYSLNSRSVQYDQYQAISMLVDPQIQVQRITWLQQTDFIRAVIQARMTSQIDWENTTVNILGRSPDGRELDVEYAGHLLIDGGFTAHSWHLQLTLAPVEPNDSNIHGVGILQFMDRANEPIF